MLDAPLHAPAIAGDAAPLRILEAKAAHVSEIQAIYGWYVLNATCTFEEVVPTVREMHQRLDALRREGLPWLVAVREERVLGYAYAGRYRARSAYLGTVESSIYIDRAHRGQGLGEALLKRLLRACGDAHCREIVAVIGDSANAGSIAVHARVGFKRVGVLRNVGFKFGRSIDTVLMQREIPR